MQIRIRVETQRATCMCSKLIIPVQYPFSLSSRMIAWSAIEHRMSRMFNLAKFSSQLPNSSKLLKSNYSTLESKSLLFALPPRQNGQRQKQRRQTAVPRGPESKSREASHGKRHVRPTGRQQEQHCHRKTGTWP